MSVIVTPRDAAGLVDKGTITGVSSLLGMVPGGNEKLVDTLLAQKIKEALDKEGVDADVVVDDGLHSASMHVLTLALGAALGAAVVLLVSKL